MIAFHSPDGSIVYIDGKQITSVRGEEDSEHVAKGTKAIIYTANKGYAVTDEVPDVLEALKKCQ